MSSDEDEFERQQLARGTQSKRQLNQDRNVKSTKDSIDLNTVKEGIFDEIRKIEADREDLRWKIGNGQKELNKSKNRIKSIEDRIKELESVNPFYEQIATLEVGQEALDFLERNRSLIADLPHDQKELLTNMEERVRNTQQDMNVD